MISNLHPYLFYLLTSQILWYDLKTWISNDFVLYIFQISVFLCKDYSFVEQNHHDYRDKLGINYSLILPIEHSIVLLCVWIRLTLISFFIYSNFQNKNLHIQIINLTVAQISRKFSFTKIKFQILKYFLVSHHIPIKSIQIRTIQVSKLQFWSSKSYGCKFHITKSVFRK